LLSIVLICFIFNNISWILNEKQLITFEGIEVVEKQPRFEWRVNIWAIRKSPIHPPKNPAGRPWEKIREILLNSGALF